MITKYVCNTVLQQQKNKAHTTLWKIMIDLNSTQLPPFNTLL